MPTNNNQLCCGFTACSMGTLGNHSSTITIACGYYSKSIPIRAVIGTLVYGTKLLKFWRCKTSI